jgi:hypothetical protein
LTTPQHDIPSVAAFSRTRASVNNIMVTPLLATFDERLEDKCQIGRTLFDGDCMRTPRHGLDGPAPHHMTSDCPRDCMAQARKHEVGPVLLGS